MKVQANQGDIGAKLSEGGDRRSIGQADEVAEMIRGNKALFSEVLELLLSSENPVLRMRAADAIEKASAAQPQLLQPYKTTILNNLASIDQKEVRWHVAQLFSRLEMNHEERCRARAVLLGFLKETSSIVRTFSMQALADLAGKNPAWREETIALLKKLVEVGSPAMRSRGKKLLEQLG